MSVNERAQRHQSICDQLNGIYIKKNHDYGNSFEESIKEFGPIAFVVRADDKMRRIKQLIKAEAQVKDEAIEDTVRDLANYCLMFLMSREGEHE